MMVPTITGIIVVLTCYRKQDLVLLKVYKKSVGVCIFFGFIGRFLGTRSHNYAFCRTACVIAVAKARDIFEPSLLQVKSLSSFTWFFSCRMCSVFV